MGKADFTKIPGGLPGVQTRGTLLYTYGVRTGKITVEKMCQLLCENPAKLYGVYPNKGVIAEGSDADIVVFDPEKENVISAETHAYNTDNNPYEGLEYMEILTRYSSGENLLWMMENWCRRDLELILRED